MPSSIVIMACPCSFAKSVTSRLILGLAVSPYQAGSRCYFLIRSFSDSLTQVDYVGKYKEISSHLALVVYILSSKGKIMNFNRLVLNIGYSYRSRLFLRLDKVRSNVFYIALGRYLRIIIVGTI
jgi:hypothetical protein